MASSWSRGSTHIFCTYRTSCNIIPKCKDVEWSAAPPLSHVVKLIVGSINYICNESGRTFDHFPPTAKTLMATWCLQLSQGLLNLSILLLKKKQEKRKIYVHRTIMRLKFVDMRLFQYPSLFPPPNILSSKPHVAAVEAPLCGNCGLHKLEHLNQRTMHPEVNASWELYP